jgi:pimeloyl-ACP methyl ester carboxylesterase
MGADHRAFSYITLPKGFHATHIPWIQPHKNEQLSTYALRLTTGIKTSEPFILVGLSMGGMMAVEIAKKIPPVCTILISSIPMSAQLPRYYRIAGKLKANILLSPFLSKTLVGLTKVFISRSSPTRLAADMFQAIDYEFFKWSMTAVLQWDNRLCPRPLFHIHGMKDRTLPIRPIPFPEQVICW